MIKLIALAGLFTIAINLGVVVAGSPAPQGSVTVGAPTTVSQ